jgi:ArsR family transcriptional regulator, lead/cadmium/zinc/bismuth-responsive transcriptional repressor
MRLDKNICIRIDRDEEQINRSKLVILENGSFLERNAALFNLLGNSVRNNIVFLLLEESKLCVCDLSEILEMKIPAVSQHLRKLKDGGVLSSLREGTIVFYYISESVLPSIKGILEQEIAI